MADAKPFWQVKSLEEMTPQEWESLCDGCGKCCLNKLLNEEGELFHTNVACRMLDCDTIRCKRYDARFRLVPDCVRVSPEMVRNTNWLPTTCAYRLLAEGKELASWHPLISGRAESVQEAGISVRGRIVSERAAGPLEHHIVEWLD